MARIWERIIVLFKRIWGRLAPLGKKPEESRHPIQMDSQKESLGAQMEANRDEIKPINESQNINETSTTNESQIINESPTTNECQATNETHTRNKTQTTRSQKEESSPNAIQEFEASSTFPAQGVTTVKTRAPEQPAPPTHVKIVPTSGLLNSLLKNYIAATAVKAVAIVDKDGLIIATQVAGDMNELSIGGVTAAIEKLYDRIKMEFKLGGRFGTTTFEHETGKIIFVNAGPTAILTTLASVVASTDIILPYSYIVAEKIAQILDKRKEIDVSMPKMATEPMKFSFKVVILGDQGVDKMSLLNRFVSDSFERDYKSTIGASIMRVDYKIMENVTVGFALWDLAGQQFFQKVRKMYLAGCQAALFVYDVTRPETLYNLRYWKGELDSIAGADVKSLMVGNKADLTDQRKVSFEEGKKVADELGLSYLETSAKTGDNVIRAFGVIAYLLVKDKIVKS